MIKTIELDCPPGWPRPGDLIAGVVAGTPLEGLPEAQPEATVSRVFGCWLWNFKDVPDEVWEQTKPVLKRRITALYHSGMIRYGSW